MSFLSTYIPTPSQVQINQQTNPKLHSIINQINKGDIFASIAGFLPHGILKLLKKQSILLLQNNLQSIRRKPLLEE